MPDATKPTNPFPGACGLQANRVVSSGGRKLSEAIFTLQGEEDERMEPIYREKQRQEIH